MNTTDRIDTNKIDRRSKQRRERDDRRVHVRFGDILGRRSGVERRLDTDSDKQKKN